jgi:drug/metabolite transporter (DMT)-like permease
MEENYETNKGNKHQSSNLWLGLIFVFGGIALILNQLNLLPFELNWWALFIMMPAAGFLSGAYNRFRSHGNLFATDVAFSALIGLFLTALSFSLLVGAAWNINWNLFWPIIIILIGLGMVFGRANRE